MAKIKWQSKADIEAKKAEKEQFKNKKIGNLSNKEKDKLLEVLAKQAGLI